MSKLKSKLCFFLRELKYLGLTGASKGWQSDFGSSGSLNAGPWQPVALASAVIRLGGQPRPQHHTLLGAASVKNKEANQHSMKTEST